MKTRNVKQLRAGDRVLYRGLGLTVKGVVKVPTGGRSCWFRVEWTNGESTGNLGGDAKMLLAAC